MQQVYCQNTVSWKPPLNRSQNGKGKNSYQHILTGHTDLGKSTITGHLIYKWGGIDQIFLKILRRWERAAEMGKGYFMYAWVLDKLKAKYECGITTDMSLGKFKTINISLWKLWGHCYRNDKKHDYRHILGWLYCLGLLLLVLVNLKQAPPKMGRPMSMPFWLTHLAWNNYSTEPPYSQKRYKERVKEVSTYIKKSGYNSDTVVFVPTSGWNGENMLEPSTNIPWFK